MPELPAGVSLWVSETVLTAFPPSPPFLHCVVFRPKTSVTFFCSPFKNSRQNGQPIVVPGPTAKVQVSLGGEQVRAGWPLERQGWVSLETAPSLQRLAQSSPGQQQLFRDVQGMPVPGAHPRFAVRSWGGAWPSIAISPLWDSVGAQVPDTRWGKGPRPASHCDLADLGSSSLGGPPCVGPDRWCIFILFGCC